MTQKIEKPWGYEEIWALTEDYVGKLIVINAGHRLSKQYHEKKAETIYVMEGVLLNYDKDDNITKYTPGQSLHINPGQIHRFGALENKYVKIIEVSTNHLDDVVRLDDDYGRKQD
tara:strand:+ start:1669 stop:2013 length:345 start_codon:yes stop_codon:yes gene_type:complete